VGAGSGFSIEGWINPGGTMSGQAYPIAEWNNTNTSTLGTHFYANVTHPGNLYANIIEAGGAFGHVIETGSGVVTANTFQHVALTYDKVSGIARLYCNGAMALEQNIGSFTPETSYDLWLGARPTIGTATSLEFPGLIDELAIYNRALSSNEVATIYNT